MVGNSSLISLCPSCPSLGQKCNCEIIGKPLATGREGPVARWSDEIVRLLVTVNGLTGPGRPTKESSTPWITRQEGAYIMTSPAVPFIECEQIHAGLAASDIPTAVEFYVK